MRTSDPLYRIHAARGLIFVSAGLLLGSVLESDPAFADWSGTTQDAQISFDDNEYARGVQVILDEFTGSLHAFWMEDSPTVREVLYARSTDGGTSWSSAGADRVISQPDGNAAYEEPAVAYGDGFLVVVWSEDLSGTREVHFGISTDSGNSFSSESVEAVLSDPDSAVDTFIPSVVVDQNGVIHVVWHQSVAGTSEVCYSRSTDMGATWSGTAGDQMISFPDGNGAADPKIMVGAEDRLVVIWKEASDLGGRTLQVGISDDGGNTWSSETADREISIPVNLMTNIDAASGVFGSNELYAVYGGSFDESSPFHYETYVTYSTNNGDTWTGESTTIPVSFDEDHTRSASNADIFVSSCGGTIAAWDEADDVSGTNEIHISELGAGGNWSGATEDVVVSFPDGENGYRPAITGVTDVVIVPGRSGSTPPDTWILWTEFEGGATDNYEVHQSGSNRCSATSAPSPEPRSSFLSVQPSPANGPMRIELEAPASTQWTGPPAGYVSIFDAGGRQVFSRTLNLTNDRAAVVWDPTSGGPEPVPSGVYFIRARAGSFTETRTIVVR